MNDTLLDWKANDCWENPVRNYTDLFLSFGLALSTFLFYVGVQRHEKYKMKVYSRMYNKYNYIIDRGRRLGGACQRGAYQRGFTNVGSKRQSAWFPRSIKVNFVTSIYQRVFVDVVLQFNLLTLNHTNSSTFVFTLNEY